MQFCEIFVVLCVILKCLSFLMLGERCEFGAASLGCYLTLIAGSISKYSFGLIRYIICTLFMRDFKTLISCGSNL